MKKEEKVVSLQEKELGKELGFIHEGLITLRKAGMTHKLWAEITESEELAKKVVDLIKQGCLKLTTSQRVARKIMDKNFFGIEEAVAYLGVNPTIQQITALLDVPFSKIVLKESKNTHVLVAVFPLSILEIRDKVKSIKLPNGQPLFSELLWYSKESFAKECDEVSWQLVRKTEITNSTSKNWWEQQTLLGKNDEVPTAQVIVYTVIGHYLATRERLLENVYVRTSSVDSGGNRIYVGGSDAKGFSIGNVWDDRRCDDLGVSSAWRKFPKHLVTMGD